MRPPALDCPRKRVAALVAAIALAFIAVGLYHIYVGASRSAPWGQLPAWFADELIRALLLYRGHITLSFHGGLGLLAASLVIWHWPSTVGRLIGWVRTGH
jgi:hypothetical protein